MLNLHRLIVYVVAVLAIAIAALDYLGVDLVVRHFSPGLVSELTLITVGFLALHVAIQDSELARIRRTTANAPDIIVKALRGARFEEFSDASAYWNYLTRRIDSARHSVDDLTWGHTPTAQVTAAAKKSYASYRKAIADVTRGKGRHSEVVYREIMSFPDGYRLGRVRTLFDASPENYHLRFYDFNHDGTPRLLQFILIDQEELLIGVHGETGLAGKFISITSSGLVQAMAIYFEICWREGIVLKDGNHVDTARLSALESRVAQVRS